MRLCRAPDRGQGPLWGVGDQGGEGGDGAGARHVSEAGGTGECGEVMSRPGPGNASIRRSQGTSGGRAARMRSAERQRRLQRSTPSPSTLRIVPAPPNGTGPRPYGTQESTDGRTGTTKHGCPSPGRRDHRTPPSGTANIAGLCIIGSAVRRTPSVPSRGSRHMLAGPTVTPGCPRSLRLSAR